jgi:hypothetical protein
VIVTCSVLLGSCGGTADEQDIRGIAKQAQQAFEDRRLANVCELLTPTARRQVIGIGHGTIGACRIDLHTVMEGVRAARHGGVDGAPQIRGVAIDGDHAWVTMTLGGSRPLRVPFARHDGEWRIDALYGGVPAAQQEDRF